MADLVGTERQRKWKLSCEMCGEGCPKYRCPACGRETCSLPCVKQHKTQFGCSGVRCKTSFISKDNYEDNTMLNDFRFLEDVNRVASTAVRDTRSNKRRWEANTMNFMRKARKSGVNVRLMPNGMSKRRENTSYFNSRNKKVMWRIKWLFPQAEAEYVDNRVSESEVVRHLLKKYVDPDVANPVIKQRLKPYCAAGVENICVFLKSEYQPASSERYFQLDTSQTLQKCLVHKTIVEYPTLHVVLSEKANNYLMVDSSQQGGAMEQPARSSTCNTMQSEQDLQDKQESDQGALGKDAKKNCDLNKKCAENTDCLDCQQTTAP